MDTNVPATYTQHDDRRSSPASSVVDGSPAPLVAAADLTSDLTVVTDSSEPVKAPAPTPSEVASTSASPVPTPSVLIAPSPSAMPAAAAVTPNRPRNVPRDFGRIDELGNAFLRTPEGEVPIGQWAAGTVEEGFDFFGVKYDDLFVEIDLARQRLHDGRGTVDQAATVLAHVRASLITPIFMGDITVLTQACDNVDALLEEARQTEQDRRKALREKAREQRELIAAEAETLADSTQWKATGERFAALLDLWKAAPRIERGAEQAMWQRFSAARTTFDKARRTYFSQRDVLRKEAISAKEALIQQATELGTSTDWAGTAREFRHLMDRWKAAPNAGRKIEDSLWKRFRAAQDVFFAARDAANAERDAEFQANLEKKLALVSEAEQLLPVTNVPAAKKAMRGISERWEGIGFVPRANRDQIEGRLRKVEDAIRTQDQEAWSRSNPETVARASDTAAKFREALAKAQKKRDAARVAGDAKAAADAQDTMDSMETFIAAAEGAVAESKR